MPRTSNRPGPLSHLSPTGAWDRALQVIEGGLVRVDVAYPGAALDGHVANRHAFFHGHGVKHAAAILVGVADAALDPQLLDDIEGDVLGGDPGLQLAVHVDTANLQGVHRQALGGQNIPHLGGADAEGQGAEGPVGGGVGIPAGDGHARLGEPHFGPHDMHDALVARLEIEEVNAELADVFLDGPHHLLGLSVREGPGLALGGHDVVHGGEGAGRGRPPSGPSPRSCRRPGGW